MILYSLHGCQGCMGMAICSIILQSPCNTPQHNAPLSGGGRAVCCRSVPNKLLLHPAHKPTHFDAACLASLRALEAFSPNKELNAPNTHMLPKIQCLPKLALELGSELMALDLQWSAAKYINCICKTWVASYPA